MLTWRTRRNPSQLCYILAHERAPRVTLTLVPNSPARDGGRLHSVPDRAGIGATVYATAFRQRGFGGRRGIGRRLRAAAVCLGFFRSGAWDPSRRLIRRGIWWFAVFTGSHETRCITVF